MRRIAALITLFAGTGVLFVAGSGASSEGADAYMVRAIFDNGGFVVEGEEVRIAGAKVGVVDSVDVTLGEEAAHEDGSPDPGKAVVVMRIDDPGFHSWREDASCLIRPQSLLGEKFVECEPTQPRAAGTEAPPELEVVGEGEPGEGQAFLAVERNLKAVDLDLVNNIMEEPYPDRFRLLLNELGIGLAARGEDLDAIIERGNPALRETNELLAVLKGQTAALNRLASDGDRALLPLRVERESISGFINNAAVAGEATAERTTELEAGFQKMPGFFRELRATMVELEDFTDQTTPVISDFGDAAPSLTRATRALGPFSRAGREALISLGDAAEDAGPDLVASVPVIKDLGRAAEDTEPAAEILADLLIDLRDQGGYVDLTKLFFYGAGATNGFDSFGHFLRAIVPVNNCFLYKTNPEPGCDNNFNRTFSLAQTKAAQKAFYEPAADPADADDGDRRSGRKRPAVGEAPSEGEAAAEVPEMEDVEQAFEFLMGDGE